MDQERIETKTGDRSQPAQHEWLVADMVYQPAVPEVGHLAYIAGSPQRREEEGRPTGAGRVLSVHPSLEGHTEILHVDGELSLLNTASISLPGTPGRLSRLAKGTRWSLRTWPPTTPDI